MSDEWTDGEFMVVIALAAVSCIEFGVILGLWFLGDIIRFVG
jgi:hypothetical protein